jgi:hypothetical protein
MTTIIIAVVALAGSVFSAAVVVWGQLLTQRRADRKISAETLEKYREPLVSAAYDLQSRIFNMLRQGFVEIYVRRDQWERREIALSSTLYVFAQFFGWREILRQEVQLLKFERQAETREISALLSDITNAFSSDLFGPRFLLWKPEQRALGEMMISEWRDQPACIGYATFIERLSEKPNSWIQRLEADVVAFGDTPDVNRLREVQHRLVALVERLDPEEVRYPRERLRRA